MNCIKTMPTSSLCVCIGILLAFLSQHTYAKENTLTSELLSLCSNITCLPGRECRILSHGIPECVCKSQCPKRKNPICGSDGISYENHCHLHRQACLKGIRIRPRYRDTSCHDDPLAKLKHDIDQAMEEIQLKEREHIRVPRACHQNDRDRMREYLISWMALSAHKNQWYKKGMPIAVVLEHFFKEMDSNSDSYVDSTEWLHLLKTKTSHHRDKGSRKLRKLCVEALVEEGDQNQDWRLTVGEFKRLMSEDFQPSNKYCVRDRKHYEDGTRTKVDCNGCTCACGKWICTSHPCSASVKSAFTSTEEYGTYDDMDNQVD